MPKMKTGSQIRSGGGNVCLSALLLLVPGLFGSGCGIHSPDLASPPPFNTGLGEGSLVGNPLVTTYATAATATQTGLDTFYSNTICPSDLLRYDPQDCVANEASLIRRRLAIST
jgi:hypothetical protein